MDVNKKAVFIVIAVILILILSVASIAVGKTALEARKCAEAGCAMWQNCPKDFSCPRVGGAAGGCCPGCASQDSGAWGQLP